ncbi:MAG: FAD-dependent oxidoreductase, partial [Anaerolineales bacterium]|nr:FAD-dependent oxidoreductase [Anaerolineales bacterium]
GGMYRIVEALVVIAEAAGVEFVYDTAVTQIAVNGATVKGVTLEDGRFLQADAVVANADLPYVYQNLLPTNGTAQKMERKRYSCSVISFFWGVDKPYPQLPPHTLFLADDYRENFDSII